MAYLLPYLSENNNHFYKMKTKNTTCEFTVKFYHVGRWNISLQLEYWFCQIHILYDPHVRQLSKELNNITTVPPYIDSICLVITRYCVVNWPLYNGYFFQFNCITHWCRVTHICVSELTIFVPKMYCSLVVTKPLSEPVLAWWRMYMRVNPVITIGLSSIIGVNSWNTVLYSLDFASCAHYLLLSSAH